LNNYFILILILTFFFSIYSFSQSYAEVDPILITFSGYIGSVDFDGKWTFFSEWKESSLNSAGNTIIRSAHKDNFIYIFIDVLDDHSLDIKSDRAMICFDPNNSKSKIPENDDYCFSSSLKNKLGYTMKGNSQSMENNYFENIPNHEDFIAIGEISDHNDRYSEIPHPSYEFRIPTDLITRSNHYGFYLETFDAASNQTNTWPPNITSNSSSRIPGPEYWGDMISPDRSLPEFPFPIVFFFVILFLAIILSRKLHYKDLRINIH